MSAATSSGARPVTSTSSTPGELAHPRQLAACVVARAALHRVDVAGEQLLEARAPCGRSPTRPAASRRADLLDRARRRPSRRRARRSARTARRAPSSGRSSRVGWRVSASTAGSGLVRRLAARPARAARARGRRAGVSLGAIVCRGPRRARAPARRAAPAGPRSRQLARPARARSSSRRRRAQVEVGERRAQVEARCRRRRSARALGEQAVDLGVRELGVLGRRGSVASTGRNETSRCSRRALLRRVADAGEHLEARGRPAARRPRPRPGRSPRPRRRSASAIATAVLPTPVGPKIASTGRRAMRRGSIVAVRLSVRDRLRAVACIPTLGSGRSRRPAAAARGARRARAPTSRWSSPPARTSRRPRRRSRASTRRSRPRRSSAAAPAACSARGREVEDGTAVAVWAAALDGGSAEPFHARVEADDEPRVDGLPDLDGAARLFLLPDPYSFPTDAR